MIARSVLAYFSVVYGLAVSLRNWSYDQRWRSTSRPPVPVISIGNVTLGGTGKTPMVEWVARRLLLAGRKPVILSRGYGSRGGLNDEGRVLAANLPGVPHLQGKNRSLLAEQAVRELGAASLVLDDGFQHRRLERDLDVVLIDALDPDGTGRLFPRGFLREPLGSLRRASVLVLSRADLVDQPTRASIRRKLEQHAGPKPWVESAHAPVDLVDAHGGSSPLEELQGRRVAAFCGLGNPAGFRRTIEGLGATPVHFRAFPDHHPYGQADLESLGGLAKGVDLVLTTQKDLVKIPCERLGTVPLRALRIGLCLLEGGDGFERAVDEVAQLAGISS